MSAPAREHGGDIDAARLRHGGAPDDWIDLSTGINRQPYPVADLPATAWTALPTLEAGRAAVAAARAAYGTPAAILPLAGAQAAIQLLPRLRRPGLVGILSPTYNEHAAAFAACGWTVAEVDRLSRLEGFDAAVVVNPNNPTGETCDPDDLIALAGRTGLLVVDESFADPLPGLSLAPRLGDEMPLVVLRSFGKFYGLAGLRLGFVLGGAADIAALAAMAGPWAVSGPALHLGAVALHDRHWALETTARLHADAARLDRLAADAGWTPEGGTPLFRLLRTPDAATAQERLAQHRIWTRRFAYSDSWLRLGLPGNEAEWARLSDALPRATAP